MERLCDVLFEFSNEDRLEILRKLLENPMNVTTLTRELEMTTQECSRHLSRLSEARLVEKSPEGSYSLTQFGRLSLRLIRGQLFVAEHADYFFAHTLEGLPSEFVCRIGELQGGDPTEDVTVTLFLVESIIKEAEEYIWMIHDQYFLNILPLCLDALKRGVRMRTFEPLTWDPGKRLDPMRPHYIDEEDELYFMEAWQEGQVSTRFSDDIGVYLYVSEKQAVIAFPSAKGGFDYLGFSSADESVLSYCRDVFDFFWERGEPLTRERGMKVLELRKRFYREKKAE
jgi:predicted transcriptional regulator